MNAGSLGTGPPPRVLPSDRDRSAETLAWLSDALDAVAGISRTLMDDGKMDRDPVAVFSAAKPALRRLANFRSLAFLSVDEDGLTFDLEDVDPDRAADLVRRELAHQVDEGTFAWSIYQNRAVIVPGAHLGPWIVLHPLATTTRVLGMFMGSLSAESAFLPDTCQKVLSILLLNCASEMESGLLYRELNRHNQNLEAIIEERTEELRRSEQAARSASRAKSEFLANMSHEIRTPINGIVGMNSLMLAGELGPQQTEQAETIQRSADNLLTIINDILDFSKIEAGHLDLEELPYDIRVAAEDVCELLSARAHAKGVEVLTRFRPGTPNLILGDPGRMRQILTNLIGNAIKFTDSGHVVADIGWTPSGVQGGSMRVSVEDTGIGIEPDELARIFDKFTQADTSTTRVYGGTGLGLSISRQLARLMGGDLRVESESGAGSRFIVEIPAEVAEGGDAQQPAVLSGVGIAILAQSAAVRSSIKETLDGLGARTIVAPDIDALEALVGSQPNDLGMAMVDFSTDPHHLRETATRLQALSGSGSPYTVLLTTMTDRPDALALVGRGFDEVLLKPVRYRRLMEALAPVARQAPIPPEDGRQDIFAQPAIGSARVSGEPSEAIVGARVLLVEDEPVNRLVASQMIKKLGHVVEVVGNGQEAVNLLEQHGSDEFDLIFMDCQTPVLDGFEATRQIRAREAAGGPRATIVALTASALQGDRERCLAAGMDDYLSKPVRIGDIEEMLARWLLGGGGAKPVASVGVVETVEAVDSVDVVAVGATTETVESVAPDPVERSGVSGGRPERVPRPRAPRPRAPVAMSVPTTTRVPAGVSGSPSTGSVAPDLRRRSPATREQVVSEACASRPHSEHGEEPMPTALVLDTEAALATLGDDWDLFWTITDMFADGWPEVQGRFEAAVRDQDADALRRAAHFLKGGSGNVGAALVRELSADLEQRAAGGLIDDAPDRLESIRSAMGAYLQEVAALRAQVRSAAG